MQFVNVYGDNKSVYGVQLEYEIEKVFYRQGPCCMVAHYEGLDGGGGGSGIHYSLKI